MQEWAIVLVLLSKQICFLVSSTLSVIHAAEEVYGSGGPLWDYFGRLCEVKIASWLGAITVGLLLPAALVIVAYYTYLVPSPWFIGLLVGLRLGDFLFSHLLPRIVWQTPNPGFISAWGYLVEGTMLIYTCSYLDAFAAFLGAAVFALVMPTLIVASFISHTREF
jgi:hypothetical protein